jgi:phosphonate transport system substrate-binding protein
MKHSFARRQALRGLAVAALASSLLSAAHADTPAVLRVSAIPDEAPTELQRKFKPLGEYLSPPA